MYNSDYLAKFVEVPLYIHLCGFEKIEIAYPDEIKLIYKLSGPAHKRNRVFSLGTNVDELFT